MVVDVVVEVVVAQPAAVHASQQLGKSLVQTLPPLGAVHAPFLSLHFVLPFDHAGDEARPAAARPRGAPDHCAPTLRR
jgi:hypothetical protein